jgi:hypothetical protein
MTCFPPPLTDRLPRKFSMTPPQQRYVAKAEAGVGWRVWNRRAKRWWGNFFPEYPQAVLEELNGAARPEVLTQLCKSSQSRERIAKNRRK